MRRGFAVRSHAGRSNGGGSDEGFRRARDASPRRAGGARRPRQLRARRVALQERGNRYRYDLSNETLGNLEDRSTKDIISHLDDTGIAEDTFKFIPWPFAPYVDPPFVTPGPLGHFRASAQADLDGDLTIDQWSIASYDRYTRDGVLIAKAGEPYCDVDDSVQ